MKIRRMAPAAALVGAVALALIRAAAAAEAFQKVAPAVQTAVETTSCGPSR